MGVVKIIENYLAKRSSPQASKQFQKLATERQVAKIHRKGILKAEKWRGKKDLKINFGGGSIFKDGFLNIDYSTRQICDWIFVRQFL